MTIQEAINAGLYPKDGHGHSIVKTRARETFWVSTANAPGDWPIKGHNKTGGQTGWTLDGRLSRQGEGPYDLMPPSTDREMTVWMSLDKNSAVYGTTFNVGLATSWHDNGVKIYQLTGTAKVWTP